MNEYDQRQYQLMKQFLTGFKAGNLNIRVLIDSLTGLINALQESKDEWKASFNKEWWTLEEIYAVASDRGQTHLSQAEQNLVDEAIDNMKKLLEIVIFDSSSF